MPNSRTELEEKVARALRAAVRDVYGVELEALLEAGEDYGRRKPSGNPMILEYVSVNPTGPMTVAHGRHAAYGDSLSRILQASGRKVAKEYYFNDGGNQIRLLGESVAVRYAELFGKEWCVPDPGF